ncbi:MAG: endonuclease Q family protein [Negativicutes bacterium]|nr:endonuclease Q family protein [Negativicutes bacterium]
MKRYFVDLHIHVGINEQGKWVKIPTSRQLTVRNILREAADRKGMQIIGIVDALSPLVLEDLKRMEASGELRLLPGGGYRYNDSVTLLPGAEIETAEPTGGLAHTLIYLPDFKTMQDFSQYMSRHIRNIHISSQNAHMPLRQLVAIAAGYEAIIIPAHIFTPHKSLFGACTDRLMQIVSEKEANALTAVELGLSADTFMADRISELAPFSFVTNSDAHSLDKIAREYFIIEAEEPAFQECLYALSRKWGRGITANYGLNPRLGKYHRTCCQVCSSQLTSDIMPQTCPYCGSAKIVHGVLDRISQIADSETPVHPEHRPPYFYQIPLEFIPGVGGKTLQKLLKHFGTEMNVIHQASEAELATVIGARIAEQLIAARRGESGIVEGGGGVYGRLTKM